VEVNFILLPSVSTGVAFPVIVIVKHVAIGTRVTIELSQVAGVAPTWPGASQDAVAQAAFAGATDASVAVTFGGIVLGGPGRAHLKAVATDDDSGYDVHADHTDVV
jgi:hypothetical protein